MEKKVAKHYLMTVIQGCYEGEWYDIAAYDPEQRKELREDLKTYRENEECLIRTIRILWKRGVTWGLEQRWSRKKDCIK